MEPSQHQRVLPSNAPNIQLSDSGLPSSPRDLCTSYSHDICPDFNYGVECKTCNHRHICLACYQDDHGFLECKASVSQSCYSKIGLQSVEASPIDSRDLQYGIKAPSVFASPPPHSAQAAIRREHKRLYRQIAYPFFKRDRCEEQSPRYMQYRAKQHNGKQKDGRSNPWSDEVEEAFQIGESQSVFQTRR